MSYKHITFDQSEVLTELKKTIKKLSTEYGSLDPIDIMGIGAIRESTKPGGTIDQEKLKELEKPLDVARKLRSDIQHNWTIFSAVFGFMPGIGDALDLLQGLYYLASAKNDDDIYEAILQIGCAVPILGDPMAKPYLVSWKLYKAAKKTGNLKKLLRDPSTKKTIRKILSMDIVPVKNKLLKIIKNISLFLVSLVSSAAMIKNFYSSYKDESAKQEEYKKLLSESAKMAGAEISSEDANYVWNNQNEIKKNIDFLNQIDLNKIDSAHQNLQKEYMDSIKSIIEQ